MLYELRVNVPRFTNDDALQFETMSDEIDERTNMPSIIEDKIEAKIEAEKIASKNVFYPETIINIELVNESNNGWLFVISVDDF